MGRYDRFQIMHANHEKGRLKTNRRRVASIMAARSETAKKVNIVLYSTKKYRAHRHRVETGQHAATEATARRSRHGAARFEQRTAHADRERVAQRVKLDGARARQRLDVDLVVVRFNGMFAISIGHADDLNVWMSSREGNLLLAVAIAVFGVIRHIGAFRRLPKRRAARRRSRTAAIPF